MFNIKNIEIKNIDHLGIVAGIVDAIDMETRSAGRFIIATNVLKATELSNDKMITDLHCAAVM